MELKEIVKQIVACRRSDRVDYLMEYLTSLNLSPKLYRSAGQNHIQNIEYRKEGMENRRDLVVFAHHDISLKTKEGANDNTSSVAVLLKLAERIAGMSFPYNIRFVFNDHEELLGALHPATTTEELKRIITNVGSFMYLKDYIDRERIQHVVILELCGIGDTVYVAKKSGTVETDSVLNRKLLTIAEKYHYKTAEIPIPSTDMISVKTFGLSGTVIGAIPFYQAESYRTSQQGSFVPAVWKNIHSDKDNLFALDHRSLDMMFRFLLNVLQEIEIV